ncbi:MAG: hypothetical protein HGA31_02035 [Candidatus Moranbacteria bacterium]|nr:hypothetical protein [Candidatus Moranbacteria bacterium]
MTGIRDAVPPVRLTMGRYWYEIDELEKNGTLPVELGVMLKALITTFFGRAVTPEAKPHLVELAKRYLIGGIEFTDRHASYDVVCFKPEDTEKGRAFFYFAQRHPGGRFHYLPE